MVARRGPMIRKGMSRQDYQTDPAFIRAVVRVFGPISFDLAADANTTQCARGPAGEKRHFDEQDDSLTQDWIEILGVNLWLNPPFKKIVPWARKCAEWVLHPGRLATNLLFLVPAAIGANWYADHCFENCLTLALNGRLRFVGEKDDYPKDLMLCVFGHAGGCREFGIWEWKDDDARPRQ